MAVVLPEIGDKAFIPEVWALYGVGVTILLLRFAVRLRTVGVKGFQGDDYFSIFTLATYTIDAVTVHNIFYIGTNVEAGVVRQTQTLTAADIKQFERGSKEQLAAWYSYTALIWSMKATMLFFFHRLTTGLWQHKFIKWLGGICAISYIAVMLTITFGCFPTYKNWQVLPDPGQQCTLKLQNFLVTVVLNVITDALILAIPVPLLWTLRVPVRRKLVIGLLLCSGMFVIAAAIIRVVLTLGSNPSATNINRWGVRETIVGIITINAPILRPMFRRQFWSAQSWKDSSLKYGESRTLEGDTVRGAKSMPGGKAIELSDTSKGGAWESSRNVTKGGDLEGGRGVTRKGSDSTIGDSNSSARDGSMELIMQASGREGDNTPMEVNVQTEVWVKSESVHGGDHRGEEDREEDWVRDEREHGRAGSRSAVRGGNL